jgi:hypothetical protein
MITLLWSRWPVPPPGLNALELGMIGLLVGHIAFIQYRMMLPFSLHGEKLSTQRSLKNVVLLTAVLILTYGLYVPKSWRRAAVAVGPLALLPFATLAVLALQQGIKGRQKRRTGDKKGGHSAFTCKQSVMAPSVFPKQSAMSPFVPPPSRLTDGKGAVRHEFLTWNLCMFAMLRACVTGGKRRNRYPVG